MATMRTFCAEPPLFAGDTIDVHGLDGHKLPWHAPQCIELPAEEVLARLLTDADRQELNGAAHAAPAARAAPANDPLAGMTPWQIYQRCIWISDEDAYTKIMLLCVSRFMNRNLRASSMSYAQIARDCGFSERTAKRCAPVVADTWLRIGVGKGRYVPGKGHENRYDGIIPQKWADELRRRMLGGIAVEPDEAILKAVDDLMASEAGVSGRHLEGSGVTHRHPEEPISGCQAGTGVSDSPDRGVRLAHVHQTPPEKKKEEGADARADLFAPDGVDPTAAEDTAKARRKEAKRQEAKAAFDLYVETAQRCGLAVPVKPEPWMSEIAARLREAGIDGWKQMLAAVEASPFLCGENDRGFRADLDWLSKPKNFHKVLSGKYADSKRRASSKLNRGVF
jgi:hypothetical protein